MMLNLNKEENNMHSIPEVVADIINVAKVPVNYHDQVRVTLLDGLPLNVSIFTAITALNFNTHYRYSPKVDDFTYDKEYSRKLLTNARDMFDVLNTREQNNDLAHTSKMLTDILSGLDSYSLAWIGDEVRKLFNNLTLDSGKLANLFITYAYEDDVFAKLLRKYGEVKLDKATPDDLLATIELAVTPIHVDDSEEEEEEE